MEAQAPPPAMEYKPPAEAPPPYPVGQPAQPPPPTQPAQPGYPQQSPYPSQQNYPQAQGYQPQPGYAGQPVSSATTVVVTQPGTVVVANNRRLGTNPANTTCPYCQAHITTTTSRSCGGFVWMIAGIICLVGFVTGGITWLGCCLIPFCIPSLYDTEHTCPNCHKFISSHSHFN